jgi:hypothetical protein
LTNAIDQLVTTVESRKLETQQMLAPSIQQFQPLAMTTIRCAFGSSFFLTKIAIGDILYKANP